MTALKAVFFLLKKINLIQKDIYKNFSLHLLPFKFLFFSMKKLITFTFLCLASLVYCQDKTYSDSELKQKLDSILVEGNLLYSLENAAWHSSDLFRENRELSNLSSFYLTYKKENSVSVVYLNKAADKVLAEYLFINDDQKPNRVFTNERPLTELENDLKKVRLKLIEQLQDPKYQVGNYDGYSLNIITLPANNEQYKTYLISGTSKIGVIPFGNDYLFISDKEGIITEYKKFHSRIIPTLSPKDGATLNMTTHSHLRNNPFISATDICTFRLYAPFFPSLKEFSVYSPAINAYMIYNLKDQKISVDKKK